MQIVAVKDAEQVKDFLAVNAIMNASNPHFIRSLNNEVNEVFDAAKINISNGGKPYVGLLILMEVSWLVELQLLRTISTSIKERNIKLAELVFLIASTTKQLLICCLIRQNNG